MHHEHPFLSPSLIIQISILFAIILLTHYLNYKHHIPNKNTNSANNILTIAILSFKINCKQGII